MLRKINSLLSQSTSTSNTTAAMKQRPEIMIGNSKRSSDSAVDSSLSTDLPAPVRSANTVKLYVSYDSG